MAVFTCKMCGAVLDVEKGKSVATCNYCGTAQTLPKGQSEVVENLFNRANKFRLNADFDKAQELYEKIVDMDVKDSEAHWGIVLCKYGIEYVDDSKTHTRVPTCHRTQVESVLKDVDYQEAIKLCDEEQKAIYQKEAKAIDKIQKGILAIVREEEPYDVFICYKETDNEGKRTKDSVIANDIYYKLTEEGYKVFYAAITLEDKLGQEYEPYIFAALNSAKIMLAVGTKPEYFSAPWVKNEWSRYLKLMKEDRNRLLIPCYRDMDAYDLPEEFAHLQGQNMEKIGFIEDVIRGIKKIIKKEEDDVVVTEKVIVQEVAVPQAGASAPNTLSLLKRARIFMDDGNFEGANEYAEKVLDIDPENADAYMVKLCCELELSAEEKLSQCDEPFANNAYYIKAKRYAIGARLKQIEKYGTTVMNRLYNGLLREMKEAKTSEDYARLAEDWERLGDYNDSESFVRTCDEKAIALAKEEENEKKYQQAKELIKQCTATAYGEAINLLKECPEYKDSKELIEIWTRWKDEREKKDVKSEFWGGIVGYLVISLLFGGVGWFIFGGGCASCISCIF